MERYERPQVVATYTIDELMDEAAVCMAYGNSGPSGQPGPGGNKGPGGKPGK